MAVIVLTYWVWSWKSLKSSMIWCQESIAFGIKEIRVGGWLPHLCNMEGKALLRALNGKCYIIGLIVGVVLAPLLNYNRKLWWFKFSFVSCESCDLCHSSYFGLNLLTHGILLTHDIFKYFKKAIMFCEPSISSSILSPSPSLHFSQWNLSNFIPISTCLSVVDGKAGPPKFPLSVSSHLRDFCF